MRYPTPGTELAEFLPVAAAEPDGTLLAVLPVNGGTARLAIVGYLLPVAPGTEPLPAGAGPVSRGPVPGGPVPRGPVAGGSGPSAAFPSGAVPSVSAATGLAGVTPASAGLVAGLVMTDDLPIARTADGPLPGGLLVDTAQRRVLVDGCDTDLVYQEFELLRFLMSHPGQAFTRSQLAERAWGEPQPDGSRTVDVHVHRLRRKLGPAYGSRLRTVRRVGYLYEPPSARPA